jgi:hypothetical protein
MITVNDLHPQAMDLAEMAFWHRDRGDEEKAKSLFADALRLEQQAALLLPAQRESEPSRSILFRSAASLAYNCGDYETADWLIANGLAGFPPPEIKEELKALYDDVNFMRHLADRGISLSENQWLMTIWGSAIAHGLAPVDHLMFRVEIVTTLFYRTLERLLGKPYRVYGGVSKEIKDNYTLYINAFVPSSFAVSFQFGRPHWQLSLLPDDEITKVITPESVIDEVMECLEILEGPQPEKLKEKISDETYYENFVGLAKQIAPDGDNIQLVGFTSLRNGKETPVKLRKSREALREAIPQITEQILDKTVQGQNVFKGVLRYADSPSSSKYGTVKLCEIETGVDHKIKVPIALMKDIVQPYYGELVNVVVRRKKEKKKDELYLEEISLDS